MRIYLHFRGQDQVWSKTRRQGTRARRSKTRKAHISSSSCFRCHLCYSCFCCCRQWFGLWYLRTRSEASSSLIRAEKSCGVDGFILGLTCLIQQKEKDTERERVPQKLQRQVLDKCWSLVFCGYFSLSRGNYFVPWTCVGMASRYWNLDGPSVCYN